MLGWYIVTRRLWLACRQTDSKKSIWGWGDSEQHVALVMSLKSQFDLGRWGNE